jgi:hypothetical protein
MTSNLGPLSTHSQTRMRGGPVGLEVAATSWCGRPGSNTGGRTGGAWFLADRQVKGSRGPLRFVSTVRRLVSNLRPTERRSR